MKPTILCFSHLCNQSYITGAEKHLLFMMRELSSHFRCLLVVPQEGLLSEEARRSGIPYTVQPCQLFAGIADPFPGIEAHLEQVKKDTEWNQLIRLLRKSKPDYVLVNTCVHVWPAAAASSLGIPTLWQITECISENGYAHLGAAIIDRYADAVIVNSHAVLSPFLRRELTNRQMSRFLLSPSWHMSDLQPELWQMYRASLRKELGVGESEYVIGYVASSITAAKGLEHFIYMALSIADRYPYCRFLIVGEPVNTAYMEHCCSLIEQSVYASKFHYIRFASQIQAVYSGMDILVVPSLIPEGFGMTAMEGLVFGKAVLTYRSGGLGEIMDGIGRGGYAVDTGNYEALVHQLDQWLATPDRLVEEQRHNGSAVIQAFGIDTYRERLHRLWIDWILQQGELFSALKGSGSAVYIRTNEGYRRAANRKVLKQHSIRAIRRIPDEVLFALPMGEPITSPSDKRYKASASNKRLSSTLKRSMSGSRTRGRMLRNNKKGKQRIKMGKRTRTKGTQFRQTRGAWRGRISRYRESIVTAGSKRRSKRQFSSVNHARRRSNTISVTKR